MKELFLYRDSRTRRIQNWRFWCMQNNLCCSSNSSIWKYISMLIRSVWQSPRASRILTPCGRFSTVYNRTQQTCILNRDVLRKKISGWDVGCIFSTLGFSTSNAFISGEAIVWRFEPVRPAHGPKYAHYLILPFLQSSEGHTRKDDTNAILLWAQDLFIVQGPFTVTAPDELRTLTHRVTGRPLYPFGHVWNTFSFTPIVHHCSLIIFAHLHYKFGRYYVNLQQLNFIQFSSGPDLWRALNRVATLIRVLWNIKCLNCISLSMLWLSANLVWRCTTLSRLLW